MTILESSNDDKILWDTWMSIFHMPILTVADEIGFFSIINQGTTNLQDIANKLNVSFRGAEILANTLATLQYIIKKDHNIFLTSTVKNYLLPDSSCYWGTVFQRFREKPEHQRIMQALKNSSPLLKYQEKSFTQMWEDGTITPEAAQSFTQGMQTMHFAAAEYLAKSGVFNGVNNLLDVGAGSGCFGLAFLNNYANKMTTLFDLPNVCEIIKGYNTENKHQITIHAGNFLKESWPKNHDAILLSQILHDWPFEICQQILQSAYNSLESGGKIFIHEMLLNENKDSPTATVFFDLLMFINHRSQQFAQHELFELLTKAGFKNPSVKPMFGYFSVITASK